VHGYHLGELVTPEYDGLPVRPRVQLHRVRRLVLDEVVRRRFADRGERHRVPAGCLRPQVFDNAVELGLDPIELGLLRLAAPVLDKPCQLGLPELVLEGGVV
jgi:hypothetical protein